MEFSVRILVAIFLTAVVMHIVTIYMLLNHSDMLCKHARRVESLFRKVEQLPEQRTNGPTRSISEMQPARDFDDMFGVVTGIEAMESECYSIP